MKHHVLVILVLLGLYACHSKKEEKVTNERAIIDEKADLLVPKMNDTTLYFERQGFSPEVRINIPDGTFKGCILVLQGWNFSNSHWSDSSDLETLASEYGYALICPDMGKSIYHKSVYPETRKDWRKYPTRSWLVDTMIVELQEEFQLLLPGQPNFIMGLSTGGRGALIIAQENSEIFRAGAALSGDYDQNAFPNDNLYMGYFGRDPEKWKDQENPVSSSALWNVPMYIGHGVEDQVVDVEHSKRLQQIVGENVQSSRNWQFVYEDGAGHDYTFWAGQVETILQYFTRHLDSDSRL